MDYGIPRAVPEEVGMSAARFKTDCARDATLRG